jgi:hypothetical protein
VDERVPVGTEPQPVSAATSWMYSFEVAQAMNFCAASGCLLLAGTPSATSAEIQARYERERAACLNGQSNQDQATCLKEAGAAAQERKRNGLASPNSARQNAAERCKALPPEDKVDCLARIEGPTSANQQVTTSGSVGGGGVIRETKTTTVAPAAAVEAAPEPAASAPR